MKKRKPNRKEIITISYEQKEGEPYDRFFRPIHDAVYFMSFHSPAYPLIIAIRPQGYSPNICLPVPILGVGLEERIEEEHGFLTNLTLAEIQIDIVTIRHNYQDNVSRIWGVNKERLSEILTEMEIAPKPNLSDGIWTGINSITAEQRSCGQDTEAYLKHIKELLTKQKIERIEKVYPEWNEEFVRKLSESRGRLKGYC